jgi:hypothetical protein
VASAPVVQNIQHVDPEFLGQVLDHRAFLVAILLPDHGFAIKSQAGSAASHKSSLAALGANRKRGRQLYAEAPV